MTKENLISALFIGVCVFVAVILGSLFDKPQEVIVKTDNPQAVGDNLELGAFNPKYATATSSKITITATPTNLKTLMQTADSTLTDSAFSQINYVVLQPTTGAIRYIVGGADYATEAGMVAGTNGTIIYQTWQEPIHARPEQIYLVRDSSESSNITTQVGVFGTNTN